MWCVCRAVVKTKSLLPSQLAGSCLQPMRRVFVVGVGMTPFTKPGKIAMDYPQMVKTAGTAALTDAGVTFADVQQVQKNPRCRDCPRQAPGRFAEPG